MTKRTIKTLDLGSNADSKYVKRIRVCFDSDLEEWSVEFYNHKGKVDEEMTYFTTDAEDANDTAHAEFVRCLYGNKNGDLAAMSEFAPNEVEEIENPTNHWSEK